MTMKITKGRFAGMEVVSAAQTRITRLAEPVQRVLDALGRVSDFGLSDEECAEVARTLGLPIDRADYIADIAERLAGVH